jgi:transcriptional antiterminator RfaH
MAFWAVARCVTRHEGFAAQQLEAAGFTVFLPRTTLGALFPSYVFVRVIDRWRRIDRTVGILGVVRFGDVPAKMPDADIAALQSRIDSHGLIRLPPPPPTPARRKRIIPIGAKVKVASGPFRGFTGIYAGQTARERERILIDMLGRKAPVELLRGQLAPQADLAENPRPR